MDKKIQKITIFIAAIFVLFAKASFVLALEIQYPTILGHSLNSTSSFSEYACYLFSLGTSLSILIAVLTIAFGGVYYLLSYGRGKFTDEGKSWIKAGITGLLIVMCATIIASTINPDLTTCKLDFLPKINFNFFNSPTTPAGVGLTTYTEIPIGTLTETLLTRTMDCYGFDQEGNPANGEQIGNNKKLFGPTYLNHDRADCLTQLVDGAQKKSQVIANLSSQIANLMNSCSCSNADGTSKCDPVCDPATGCKVTQCPGGTCAGACVDGACKQPPATTDCCPEGVKDKIEHGPIIFYSNIIGGQTSVSCQTQATTYNGLDEFRCPTDGLKIKQCSNIANQVEKQIQDNDKMLTRDEAMKFLSVSSSTLSRWTKNGEIPAHGKGNRVYYKLSDLKASLVRTN